jgi:hypothetical protein
MNLLRILTQTPLIQALVTLPQCSHRCSILLAWHHVYLSCRNSLSKALFRWQALKIALSPWSTGWIKGHFWREKHHLDIWIKKGYGRALSTISKILKGELFSRQCFFISLAQQSRKISKSMWSILIYCSVDQCSPICSKFQVTGFQLSPVTLSPSKSVLVVVKVLEPGVVLVSLWMVFLSRTGRFHPHWRLAQTAVSSTVRISGIFSVLQLPSHQLSKTHHSLLQYAINNCSWVV